MFDPSDPTYQANVDALRALLDPAGLGGSRTTICRDVAALVTVLQDEWNTDRTPKKGTAKGWTLPDRPYTERLYVLGAEPFGMHALRVVGAACGGR
jgi:hypothetical protein